MHPSKYHWLSSDQGDDNDWENRRSRFGFDAKLFDKKIELRLDAQSNDEFDPFYDRLVDAYIKWKPVGLQYFIYGDKLKLMAGAEYARLDGGGNGGDYDGWTVLNGVRFYF